VSAAYTCSNGSIISDLGVINKGQTEFINNLEIALIDSSASFSADLFIDADKIKLTSDAPSIETELLTGTYNISLINLTENLALVYVGGDNENIEARKIEQIGSVYIYAIGLEGLYPGSDANIDLFVGVNYLFLHNKNTIVINTIEGVEYLFELSSASSNGAMINVKKCEDSSASIIETEEEITLNNTDNNVSIENSTSITNQDSNLSENTTMIDSVDILNDSEDLLNESLLDDELNSEDLESKKDSFRISIFMIVNIMLLIIIAFFTINYFRNKKDNDIKEVN